MDETGTGSYTQNLTSIDEILKRECVNNVMQTLPFDLRKLITLRFGLDGEGERTLAQCGDAMGYGKEQARVRIMKALRMLRHPTRAKLLPGYGPFAYGSI